MNNLEIHNSNNMLQFSNISDYRGLDYTYDDFIDKINNEIKEQILKDLNNGVIIKDIASKYNVSLKTIYKLRKDNKKEEQRIR